MAPPPPPTTANLDPLESTSHCSRPALPPTSKPLTCQCRTHRRMRGGRLRGRTDGPRAGAAPQPPHAHALRTAARRPMARGRERTRIPRAPHADRPGPGPRGGRGCRALRPLRVRPRPLPARPLGPGPNRGVGGFDVTRPSMACNGSGGRFRLCCSTDAAHSGGRPTQCGEVRLSTKCSHRHRPKGRLSWGAFGGYPPAVVGATDGG